MTTEDHITAITAVCPSAVEQKLGNLTRIVRFEGASDSDALSFYYSAPEDAWANAYVLISQVTPR